MDLGTDDEVISMSVINHVDVTTEEREDYLRYAGAKRRVSETGSDESLPSVSLSPERLAELESREQLLLTVTVNGFGKRTNAYEYRTTNRGGQGIINIETSNRNGLVAATFPIGNDDQLMLQTDAGKLIRTSADEIRIAGRNTQGVKLFHTESDEHIVSAARLTDTDDTNGHDVEE